MIKYFSAEISKTLFPEFSPVYDINSKQVITYDNFFVSAEVNETGNNTNLTDDTALIRKIKIVMGKISYIPYRCQ